jgi:hypothetical protein
VGDTQCKPLCRETVPELVSEDAQDMAVTESRFNKLETRVNDIGENVAKLHGANSVPQKPPNLALITLLSILGVGVIAY